LEQESLLNISRTFLTGIEIVSVSAIGAGHINDTFRVDSAIPDVSFILQRLNHKVFDVPALLKNFRTIQEYHKNKGKQKIYLTSVNHSSGTDAFIDSKGSCWRMLNFIGNSQAINRVETPEQAFQGAFAFGNFIASLDELSPLSLKPVIKGFHDLGLKMQLFKKALKDNRAGRIKECSEEIQFLLSHESLVQEIDTLEKSGLIPIRIMHHDTKINNVLFDLSSGKGLCVIDLDTTMPGTIFSDFGDMVRTFTNTVEEDEANCDKVISDPVLFESLTRGFLEVSRQWLCSAEVNHLVTGAKKMIFLQALRFLTDYLNGDIYYKVSKEKHNKIRARNQIALYGSLLKQEFHYREIVKNIYEALS